MTTFLSRFVLVLALGIVPLGAASAQPTSPEERLRAVAEQIDALMRTMEEKVASDEQLLVDIRERKANIERADQQVTDMIARLTELTNNMDENSELKQALGDFESMTVAFIAEAEASGDDVIKGAVPGLRETLDRLKSTNDLRSSKVQEARALIRSLEDNKTRISFFYRVGQLEQAAAQLEASVQSYATIVDGAQAVADAVLTEIAAR